MYVFSVAAEVGRAFADKTVAAQHLLLFVSALIPKAMASLLTSAVIELSKGENVSLSPVCCNNARLHRSLRRLQLARQEQVQEGTAAEHVMLEVERLWPPFFGGARVCTEVKD